MKLTLVKSAEGRRMRHKKTFRLLPNEAAADAAAVKGHKVDLDDPHWHRALMRGDIVIVGDLVEPTPAAVVPQAPAAPTTAPSTPAAPAAAKTA